MGKRAAASAAARMGANSHGGEIFPQLQYSSLPLPLFLPPSANGLTDAAASAAAVAAGLAWSAAATATSASVGVQLDGKSRRRGACTYDVCRGRELGTQKADESMYRQVNAVCIRVNRRSLDVMYGRSQRSISVARNEHNCSEIRRRRRRRLAVGYRCARI